MIYCIQGLGCCIICPGGGEVNSDLKIYRGCRESDLKKTICDVLDLRKVQWL